MDFPSLAVVLLLALLVGAFIARPILQASPNATATTAADRLQAEHEALLTALRDLDFDHTLGKIAEADYRPQREALMQRGVALLQQLDQAPAAAPVAPADAIEAEVRAARARIAPTTHCPSCGAARQPTDRFCAKCGAALSA